MKKSILVLALAALASGARAGEVSAEQACAAVEAWRVSNGATFGDLGAAVSATPMRDTDGVLLWYVVSTANGGTVVTAGDDRVEPILAVLPKEDFGGVIPERHPLHGFMRMDIRGRLQASVIAPTAPSAGGASLLSVAPAQKTLSADALAAQARWGRLAGSGAVLQAAGSSRPAMIFGYLPGFSDGTLTHWNQGSSTQSQGEALYNYYTPSHYVCGCVATAGAAILQYFNVTNGPVAYTNACTFNASKTNLVTIGGHYDWSILPKGMGGKASNPIELLTDEQRELLGRVAYDVGVCVGMGYDANGTGSGAMESALAKVFKENFGFATAEHVAFEGDKKEAAFYDRFIYNQLRCGAPVGLGIAGPAGGHSVLAVGYGEDFAGTPYTRVFMGWGGSGDAWYNLPNITGYPYLLDVITQLSLDGNCVPVCGRAVVPMTTAPSVEHSADGLVGAALVPVEVSCGDVSVTTYTGANGCFGVRVPAETAGTVKCGGQEVAFGPEAETEEGEEDGEESGEEEGGEELSPLEEAYGLLPETMTIKFDVGSVVPTYHTPSAALSIANRRTTDYPSGRMVLLVSGRQGDETTAAFMEVLAKSIDPETFNQNFVLYYSDYDTDGYGFFNIYPAVAAFNPAVFDPERGWAAFNGCIGSITTGEVPTEEEMTAFVTGVCSTWSRLTGDLVLNISSVTEGDYDALAGAAPAADFSPALGLMTTLTNGEAVVATVAPVCTNLTEGVVSKCIGWQCFQGADVTAAALQRESDLRAYVTETDPMELAVELHRNTDLLEELLELGLVEIVEVGGVEAAVAVDPLPDSIYTPIAEGTGATAEFEMAYPEMSLVWKWEDEAYRVTAEAHREGGMPGDGYGTVDFDEDWVKPGTELTITGTGALVGGGQKALTELKGWTGYNPDEGDVRDGCTLTITVSRPRKVAAIFTKGTTLPSDTPRFGVAVDAVPAELKAQEGFPLPKFGSSELVYGDNAELLFKGQQGAVTLAATSFTDSTGGVWRCVGWQAGSGDIAETGSVARVSFTATQDSAVTFVWEVGEAEDDEPLDLELKWSDGLDNLASGDDAPAGQNVLVAKSALPKNFDLSKYSPADVKNSLRGWTVTGLKLDTTGNLVAVLATNDAVLVPMGVASASPISIASNADGTVTVSSTVANAAKGFWYSLYAADDLMGPWAVVKSGFETGDPSVQAAADASESNALELAIVVDPTSSKKFYKLVVTEKDPTKE